MIKFNVSRSQRYFLFICLTLLGLVISTILMGLLIKNGLTTPKVRIATVFQDIFLFIVPAVATAAIICCQPGKFLQVDTTVKFKWFILAFAVLVCSIPAMNSLISWNENIQLPENLQSIANMMKESEQSAQMMINTLIGGGTWGSLIITLLIVAVLAGFSEEIFFRGTIQRLLITGRVNTHVAIWITAFIFSAIHFQFFGFFPRLLLGAFFGYIMRWSGSLWPAVFAHIANNTAAGTTMWMEIKQNVPSVITTIGSRTDSNVCDTYIVFASVIISVILIYICYKNRVKQM